MLGILDMDSLYNELTASKDLTDNSLSKYSCGCKVGGPFFEELETNSKMSKKLVAGK